MTTRLEQVVQSFKKCIEPEEIPEAGDTLERRQRIFTRREALSFVARNFDPLGYIIMMLLTERLLLQRLYGHLGSTWYADLPAEE